MAEKLRKCGECRERAVAPAVVEYGTSVDHDGRAYAVRVPNLPVFKCRHCGNETLGEEALERVEAAFRKAAGLLSSAEIRAGRERLKLTQKKLATALRIAEATLSRWETGAQIQQAGYDTLLRLVFESSDVQRRLGVGRRPTPEPVAETELEVAFDLRGYAGEGGYNLDSRSHTSYRRELVGV